VQRPTIQKQNVRLKTPQEVKKANRENFQKRIGVKPTYNVQELTDFGTPEPGLEDASLEALDALSLASGVGYLGKNLGKGLFKALKPKRNYANWDIDPKPLPEYWLRRTYHNADRTLTDKELNLLNEVGYGEPSNYRREGALWNPYEINTYKANNNLPRVNLNPVYVKPSQVEPGSKEWSNFIRANTYVPPQSSISENLVKKITNRSGLTKEELVQKASPKNKDVLSKMSEQDFQNTVLKPNGEVVPYYQGSLEPQFSGSQNVMALSPKQYTDEFNSRLDLLNDIIAENNKSGVNYKVKGLDESGRLTFYTPEQIIPNANKPVPQHYLDALNKINEPDFLYKGYGDNFYFSNMSGSPGFKTREEAKNWIENIIKEEKGIKIPEGESNWGVRLNPGQWRGNVEDIANTEYLRSIPGLEMSNTTEGVFSDRRPRKGSGAYDSINEYLKRLDLGRVKAGFNSQTDYSRGLWENAINKNKAVGFYGNPRTVYSTMRSLAPYAIPTAIGAGALQQNQEQPQYPTGGKVKPIVVTNPNDFRLKAYNDSLYLHNTSVSERNKYINFVNKAGFDESMIEEWPANGWINTDKHEKIGPIYSGILKNSGGGFDRNPNNFNDVRDFTMFPNKYNQPVKVYDNSTAGKILKKRYEVYKKPVQPVIYQPIIKQTATAEQIDSLYQAPQLIMPERLELSMNKPDVVQSAEGPTFKQGRKFMRETGLRPGFYQEGGKVGEDFAYDKWRRSLPENLQSESPSYNLRGYWESLNKPELFEPFNYDLYGGEFDGPDGEFLYHGFSRNPETGEILKGKTHPTLNMALNDKDAEGNVYIPYMKDGKIYTDTYSDGGTINNMKKRTLKKYQYSYGGLTVTDLNKYQLGGSNLGDAAKIKPYNFNKLSSGLGGGSTSGATAGATGSVGSGSPTPSPTGAAVGGLSSVANAIAPGAGAVVPILDMMSKATSDEYGAPDSGLKGLHNRANPLANINRIMEGKDVGRSLLGLSGVGLFSEATGLSKAMFGKSDYDIEAEKREAEKKNKETYTRMNTSENWGNSDVNTSTNMMFPDGGMVLNYDDPNANAELELQETFQMPDGTVGNVDGPSHEMGGIAVDLPEGTRIWSDKLKHNGKTFAKHTKPITNKIARLEKEIAKSPNNSEAKENSIALLNQQLDYYFDTQETNKQNTEMKRTLREGGMIKRADGSYSKRGLWDNIRANKGSGKKPTAEMLKQERKIRANEKAMGGYMYAEGGINNPGFRALPEEVQENILANMGMGGEMYSLGGRLMNTPMYAEGGKLPEGVLKSRLEAHMSPEEADEYLSEYGKGGYTVRRSSDRKGKTHVVIGPDGTKKYFGDPNLGERGKSKYGKEAFYARHKKNLAGNPYFRAYARATWEEGGTTPKFNYNNSEINQITGKPTGKGGLEDASLDVLQVITTPLALANLYKAGKISYDAYQLAKPGIINLSKTYSPTYRKALLQAGKALSPFEYGGMMGDEYAQGGIHIKPENKGKFTAYAKSHGKGVQEMAAHIMANKEDYSPTIVKRANFAKNAAGWKHEMGGLVKYEVGGPFEQDEEYLTGYGTPNATSDPFNYESSFNFSKPLTWQFNNRTDLEPTQPAQITMQPDGRTSVTGSQQEILSLVNPPSQPLQPKSNWFKDNSNAIGQLAPGLISAGVQSNRINKLARPRTLADVRLRENVANPNLVDYSAERNAIDRTALTAMEQAQRGFGSSAAAQAFKNKARLNQLEATGRSFQGQENANAQLINQFLAARQEAAIREAMMNNEISKYNLENVYGFDKMKTESLNDITQYLGDVGSDYFSKEAAVDNRMRQLEMLAKSNYKGANRKTLDDLYNSGYLTAEKYKELTGVDSEPKRNGGMIQYAEGGKVSPYKRTLNKVVGFNTNKAAQMMDAEYSDALAAGKDKYTSTITGLDYKVLPKAEKRALVTDMWREAHGEAPTQKQIESGVKAIEGKKVTSPKAKTMAEIISSRWKTGTATPEQMIAQMTPQEQEQYFLGIKDWGQFGKKQLAQGIDAVGSLGMTAIGNPLKSMFGTDLGFGSTDMSPEAVDAMVSNPNQYADAASNALLGIMGGKALGMAANKIIPKFYKPAAKYYNAEARNLELQKAKKVYNANRANRNNMEKIRTKYYEQVPEPDMPRYVKNIAAQEDEAFALEFNKRQNQKTNKKIESKLNIAEGADRYPKASLEKMNAKLDQMEIPSAKEIATQNKYSKNRQLVDTRLVEIAKEKIGNAKTISDKNKAIKEYLDLMDEVSGKITPKKRTLKRKK